MKTLPITLLGTRKTLLTLGVLSSLLLTGCGSASQNSTSETTASASQSTPNDTADTGSSNDAGVETADGPHADATRTIQPLTTATKDGITTAYLDLGNTQVGDYSAPVRGIVVAPEKSETSAPLVIINHLRYPGCEDGAFAYPCADGVKEHRLDEGMVYLAQDLAKQGYAVLIPDLNGVWVGSDFASPYDQGQMWQQATGDLIKQLTDTGNELRKEAKFASVDTSKVGLFLHSRSASLVDSAVSLLGQDNIQGILAYGPAYDTYDAENFSANIPDIPYLAISGDEDQDVGASANLWLGNYLGEERTQPALVANLPGYGHMLINTAVSGAEFDDRIGCEKEGSNCPDAAAHRKVLTTTAKTWFGYSFGMLTQKHLQDADIPLGTSTVKSEYAGESVRWLAAVEGKRTHLAAGDFNATQKGSSTLCVRADPMSPEQPANACTEPEDGVTETSFATEINLLTSATADVSVKNPKQLAVHLAPWGSSEPAANRTVKLTLKFSDSSQYQVELDASSSALQNRKNDTGNGYYLLSTLRQSIPADYQKKTLETITVTADKTIALAGIDVS